MTDVRYDNAVLQQQAKDHLWMHFARQSTMEQSGVPIITRGEGWRTAAVVDPFGNVLGVMTNPHWAGTEG